MPSLKEIGSVEDIQCATCNHRTEHTLLATYKSSWGEHDDGIWGGATHDFLRCNGCKNATYRKSAWCSEDDQRDGPSITLYPERGTTHREYKRFYNLPNLLLKAIYEQTVDAFNQKSFTLAGAGVRLLIEGICKEQGVKDGEVTDAAGVKRRSTRLDGKINGMAETGIISKNQAKELHEIRFLGNDSAHELHIPEKNVIGDAIDMVEHIFDQVYEQPEKAKSLAARKKPK